MELCLQEIQRLDRVVRGVLTLGRSTPSQRRLLPIATVVKHALEIVRKQLEDQDVRVILEGPGDALEVHGNEEQLVGMFLNLFVNAAEAMPFGGELWLTIEEVRRPDRPRAVRVVVQDSGPGVSGEARSRLFEPFFSTKSAGCGLGLSIAATEAERHRGRIALVDTNGGAGATFVVELPVADEASATA
jgi:signal transduction histidine kinase